MFEKLRGPWRKIISPIAGAVGTAFFAVLTGFTGWLLPGAAMITVMVIFDSLDGTVAAQSGGGTAFGAFLDSTVDRIADWAVLLGVAIYLIRLKDFWTLWPQIGFWAALVSMMTAFVTSYIRARAQSIGLDAKNGIATRSDRLVIILVAFIPFILQPKKKG